VNTADALELAKLPGIGAALAARIVEYREAHGSFRTLDELAAVKGIGAATVERLRDVATAGE
jgi:competence protein ComEA